MGPASSSVTLMPEVGENFDGRAAAGSGADDYYVVDFGCSLDLKHGSTSDADLNSVYSIANAGCNGSSVGLLSSGGYL